MDKISQITSDPFQTQNVLLPSGSFFSLTIRFVPMQLSWIMSEMSYQGFTLNGLRICNSPNFLYQFKNQIPFGIACFSDKNREPSLAQDFSSGASVLYVLSEAEVEAYSTFLES